MAGKKDIVKQALKLVMGAGKSVSPEEKAENLSRFMRGSQLIDEAGDPQRLYHITDQNFDTFIPGGKDPEISGPAIWLSPYADKQPAMHNVGGGKSFKEGTNVMPVYARMKSPLVLDTPDMHEWARAAFANNSSEFPYLISPETKKAIQDEGYDGIILGGRDENKDNEIIVFEGNQIKSAIGNAGSYDPDDPRIDRDAGGSVREGYAGKGRVVSDTIGKALEVASEVFAPEKTVKAYKLFKQRDGKLYPLYVGANEEVPLGQWLKAKPGELLPSGKVKAEISGGLAYRPGWHAGDLPVATHIGAKSHGNPRLPPDTRRSDEVWAEVEMPDDVDWQSVANERARITKKGTPDPKTAHITDQVPYGGFYRYKTSPTMQGQWLIGGDMRVNRLLTDDEVKAINDAAGVTDLPRREGYAGKGRVVGDAVEQALKLVSGGLKEAGPSAAERAAQNLEVLNTAKRLGQDTNDISKLQETKQLMDFHSNMMGGIKERAQELAEVQRQLKEQGAFPMEIGTRFMTSKSREYGRPPHVVTGYYVNPKDPYNSYGYRVRQDFGNGDYTEGNILIRDPKLEKLHGPEKWQQLQQDFTPMTGPRVKKDGGGEVREGYQTKGRVVGDIVDEALKLVMGKGESAAEAGIRAYQGSPHNFAAERLVKLPTGKTEYIVGQPDILPDVPEGAEVLQDFPLGRMRMDKIGTGEGAQAYGHGLYLAEHEPVAKGYRKALAGPESMGTVTFDGKTLIDKGSPDEAWHDPTLNIIGDLHARDLAFELLNYGNVADTISGFRSKAKDYAIRANSIKDERLRGITEGGAKAYSDMADFLEANPERYGVKIPGSMYEVRINADPNTFLDWDKPLSEQPQNVLDVARPFFSEGLPERKQYGEIVKGGDLYDMLVQRTGGVMHGPKLDAAGIPSQLPGGTKERLGMYLSSQGIPGIKYLDAGSRGAGDGTRNYVVFDDKLISIIRKYGIAGASAMIGYNLLENLSPDQALAASAADQEYQHNELTKANGGSVREGYQTKGRVTKNVVDEAIDLATRLFSSEEEDALNLAAREAAKKPAEIRTIKGADLLKKTEGLSDDPFGFSKFSKPLNEMEYTVKMLPREEYKTVDPYDLVRQNATIVGHISDRTAAGRELIDAGGNPLTNPLVQRGGVDYQRTTPHAWANRPGAAQTLYQKVNEPAGYQWDKKTKQFVKTGEQEGPVYTTPIFMGAPSANSSHMVGVPFLRMIPNMPISKADKLAFDAMMSERFPGWPGIDNTKEAEEFLYHGNLPKNAPTAFTKYAAAKKWRLGAGFPDIEEIMFSAMDPRLVGVKQGTTGMGFKEIDPNKKIIIKGEDYHPDYPASIPGKKYAGGFKYQTPQGIMFPEWWGELKPELRLPENATGAQYAAMTQLPTQKATPEWADRIMQYWEENPIPWGYADGGAVDEDIDDALRIARADGGANPAVMMEDAKGNKYDAQGNVIPPTAPTGPNPQRDDSMFTNTAPENYKTDVQPFIDYAVTPIDRPGMPSEPDLVDVMRVATQVAAEGQPTDDRGEGNFGRRRAETVRSLVGASPEGYQSDYKGPFTYNAGDTANFLNTLIDFSPYGALEYAHDIPYEAGRTGDYGNAAVEGGLGALMTAPGMTIAGRGLKKGYEAVKSLPKMAAGIAGVAGLTASSDEAEAGPARWFSKAMEVAGALPMEKMTGEQALAMLRKGVSPEELKWTGTDKFLTSRPQVTKGELLEHLKNNRVQLNEITLGGGGKPTRLQDILPSQIPEPILAKYRGPMNAALEQKVKFISQMNKLQNPDKSIPPANWMEWQEARNRAEEFERVMHELGVKMRQEYVDSIGGLGRPTKYEDYSTAGGKGYRETLYQFGAQGGPPKVEERNGVFAIVGSDGEVMRNQMSGSPYTYFDRGDAERAAKSLYRESGTYKSPHWDDPDVLFHTRSQTLTYQPPGANRPYKVHNVEETQSDLAQAGRKRGFKDQDAMAAVARLRQEKHDINDKISDAMRNLKQEHYENITPIREEVEKLKFELAQKYNSGAITLGEFNRIYDDLEASAQEKMAVFHQQNREKEAAIVKPLRDQLVAKEAEIERIGKNIGEMPLMPYVGNTEGWTDLAIKKELDRALDSDADYFSWSPGEVHAERYNLTNYIYQLGYNPSNNRLVAYSKDGTKVISQDDVKPDQLDEYVGKEMADKIRQRDAAMRDQYFKEFTITKEPTGEFAIRRNGKLGWGEYSSMEKAQDALHDEMISHLYSDPISFSGLDLKVGGEGMLGYYNKIYLKRVQEVIKKATGIKPQIETITVDTADGPRQQLGIRITNEMREKARFSDFKKGGRVTGGNAYDNNQVVDSALALTREF